MLKDPSRRHAFILDQDTFGVAHSSSPRLKTESVANQGNSETTRPGSPTDGARLLIPLLHNWILPEGASQLTGMPRSFKGGMQASEGEQARAKGERGVSMLCPTDSQFGGYGQRNGTLRVGG